VGFSGKRLNNLYTYCNIMKKTRYSRYQINYHFVWIPKYRRDVLTGKIKDSLDDIIRGIIDRMDGEVLSVEIQPDHVHLFVSMRPKYSPAKIINAVKGASSRKLRNRHPELKEMGDKLWTRTYYVGTSGKVSDKTIRRYIEECQGT